ncbi:hypothetical protein [Streptomyces sp. NPDC002265]|uniref:hypothetical protein n=1 Tax=Streptomyces sp. NPDC002265 TaxID=3154415 RepID=UPI003325D136
MQAFDEFGLIGWRGRLKDFGHVTIQHKKSAPGAYRGFAELFGENLPHTEYTGVGSGCPSLAEGKLSIAGQDVPLRHNSRGMTRHARALKLGYLDRSYTYTSTGYAKPSRLVRDGVEITVGPGSAESPRDRGVRSGFAVGAVDSVDLAIALIFEAVDTSALTLGGALASAPFALMRPHPRNGGYE